MAGLSKTMIAAVRWVAKRILLAWERLESGVSLDLTSSAFIENPYRTYEQLRRKDPVHRMRLVEAWALTRYEDVQDVLVDHRRFTNAERNYDYMPYRTFLDLDPPDHTRLRGLVSKAFTPRAVRELGPRIQELVDELLDAVAGKDRIDLISDFAFPLPVIVIAEMLGVPAEDRARFRVWSDDIANSVVPLLDSEQIARVQQATEELFAYFEGIIEQRRHAPQNDMISALLAAEEEGDRLTHEELLSTLMLLLVAGNETTRNLIGNGMLALLKIRCSCNDSGTIPTCWIRPSTSCSGMTAPYRSTRATPSATWRSGANALQRGSGFWRWSGPQIETRKFLPTPANWISGATKPATSPSGAAFTTASALRLRSWKDG